MCGRYGRSISSGNGIDDSRLGVMGFVFLGNEELISFLKV